MRPWRGVVTLAAGAILLGGCIGATPRDDFEEEIRSRGGGFTESMIGGPLEDAARRLGTDDLQLLMLMATPEYAAVTMEVRNPNNSREVDRYFYQGGSLQSTEPVKVSVRDDLDSETIHVNDLAVDMLEEMTDQALATFDTEGGFVSSIQATSVWGPDDPSNMLLGWRISLSSPRTDAVASFAADGEFLGLELQ